MMGGKKVLLREVQKEKVEREISKGGKSLVFDRTLVERRQEGGIDGPTRRGRSQGEREETKNRGRETEGI